VDVDGLGIFCGEAGPKDAPTILLLHGFPTAGHMFRDLLHANNRTEKFRICSLRFRNNWA
jgi:pimeloyl-ACP methyl ester carboxylesterase